MHAWNRLHPATVLMYLLVVLSLTMFTNTLAITLISLCGALLARLSIGKRRGIWLELLFDVGLMAVMVLLNPLFNPAGETVLLRLPAIGLRVTAESLLHGLRLGAMLSAVLLWCRCLGAWLPPERFLFLFGRSAPQLSLLLCVSMRQIPAIVRRYRAVRNARRAMGTLLPEEAIFDDNEAYDAVLQSDHAHKNNRKNAPVLDCKNDHGNAGKKELQSDHQNAPRKIFAGTGRIRRELESMTGLIGWSLATGFDTAQAMRARGYGFGKRSSGWQGSFRVRDGLMIGATVFFALFVPAAVLLPSMTAYLRYGCCTALVLLPAVTELWEECRWNYCKSRI